MQNTHLFVAGFAACLGVGGCELQVSPLRQTMRPFSFGLDDRFMVDRKTEEPRVAARVGGCATATLAVRV